VVAAGLLVAASSALSPAAAFAAPRIVAAAGDISPASDRSDDDEVAQMVRSVIRPDALLLVGDLQYETGSLEDFRRYYAAGWGAPDLAGISYPVPGNHEYDLASDETTTDPAAGYFRYFRRRAAVDPNGVERRAGFYSFNLGAWHVVALNSSTGGPPDPRQVRWLRRDLARDRRRCEIAFWHHPRWSSSLGHDPDPDMQPFWATAVKGGVDVVLNGHDHAYERFARMRSHGTPVADDRHSLGAREFVVGTGGKGGTDGFGDTEPGSEARWPAAAAGGSLFGALRLRLAHNAYSWRMYDVSGAILDAGGPVRCHGR
jgi:hypothetical protein